jgi:uncharacterized protein (TIGR00661 family)
MARILYGIMGNTNGHVMRTLSLIPHLAEHNFCFVAGGRAAEVLSPHHRVHDVPVLRTKHKNQKLDIPGTIAQIAGRVLEIPRITDELLDLIHDWQPDLAITDREFFLPIAAQRAGLPCLSIDHTHVLKACEYEVPREYLINHSLTMLNDYCLFDRTERNLIVSFFHPTLRPGRNDELYHPVVRPELHKVSPTQGDDVFVYLSIPSFGKLLDTLRQLPRRVIVYGSKREPGTEGNLVFRPFDQTRIFEDLASCAYTVINGGHNLISEALFFGKPILCVPIKGLFEQFLNASHVRSLGYGDYTYNHEPGVEVFQEFEKNLGDYQNAIQKGFQDGTPALARRVQEIIAETIRTA